MLSQHFHNIHFLKDMPDHALQTFIDDDRYRWAALAELGSRDSQSSIQYLAGHALSKDKYIRIAALKAIAGHCLGSELTPIIVENLNHQDDLVVRNACQVVARLKMKACREVIFNLLSANAVKIRQEAILTMHGIWQADDHLKLLPLFSSNVDLECRKHAGWVLYQNVGLNNWRKIVSAFLTDNQINRHRLWACEILSLYGGKRDIQILTRLSHDKDGHVRKRARQVIKQKRMGHRPISWYSILDVFYVILDIIFFSPNNK